MPDEPSAAGAGVQLRVLGPPNGGERASFWADLAEAGARLLRPGTWQWPVRSFKAYVRERLKATTDDTQTLHVWLLEEGGPRELRTLGSLEVAPGSTVTVEVRRGWREEGGELAKSGTVEDMRRAIMRGVYDPATQNSYGQTLTFYAVQNPRCSEEMCRLLEGLQVPLGHVDKHGQNAAHWLARTENVGCLRYFVEQGVSIELLDKFGQTPVFFAASKGMPKMIRALYEAGANVNRKDKFSPGLTPLYWAAKGEQWANCVELTTCDDSLLAWAVFDEETMYAVYNSTEVDASQLADLETEFVDDHHRLLQEVNPEITEEQVCKSVGLNAQREQRRNIITQILRSRSDSRWTLKCVCVRFGRQGADLGRRLTTNVGYCYCSKREPSEDGGGPGGFNISHVKVARSHQGRGCARLLFAGAAVRLERLSNAHRLPAQFGAAAEGRCLHLSVMRSNERARQLYKKLGFEEMPASDASTSANWVKMRRACDVPAEELVAGWLATLRGRKGFGSLVGRLEAAQPAAAAKAVAVKAKAKAKPRGKAKARAEAVDLSTDGPVPKRPRLL